ncbi:MAG: hypothetical protein P8Q22_04700 [Hellea sp.]|nr:hypothetical protein [Hellea sp.]
MNILNKLKVKSVKEGFHYDDKYYLILLLLSTVYADGLEEPSEMLVLRQIMSKSPLFADSNDFKDKLILKTARNYLMANDNSVAVACGKLSEKLKKTAFVMAVEIIFADGLVHEKELEFVDILKKSLDISDSFSLQAFRIFEALYSTGEI